MVNHLTRTTAWAQNWAGFFRHHTNVMLPAQHMPSTCDAGCSAAWEGGVAPTDTYLLLGLWFKATLNLLNLQLGGPQCGEHGAEDLLSLADS